jgi:hypothetical protein
MIERARRLRGKEKRSMAVLGQVRDRLSAAVAAVAVAVASVSLQYELHAPRPDSFGGRGELLAASPAINCRCTTEGINVFSIP